MVRLLYCANPACNAMVESWPNGQPKACSECGHTRLRSITNPPEHWSPTDLTWLWSLRIAPTYTLDIVRKDV